MGDTIQFVDKIDAAATVLLDINDDALWSTEVFSPAPPLLRRAASTSMLIDGDVEAASARADRMVTFSIDLICSSQDVLAAEVQKLARIVDRPSLLRYQPIGATHPVFMVLKRADVTALVANMVQKATAKIELMVPAEPAVVGLPVSDSVTVTNDSGATNSFGFVLDDVKGDLPARLRLVDPTVTADPMLAASAVGSPLSDTGLASFGPAQAPSGWTSAMVSASTHFGGSALRMTRDTGAATIEVVSSNPGNLLGPILRVDSGAPGDYRIFLRARASVAGAVAEVKADNGADLWRSVTLDTAYRWLDMGVVRLPSARRAGSPFEPYTVPNFTDLDVRITVPSGWVELDAALAVPAGLDVGDCTIALGATPATAGSTRLTLDDQWTVGAFGRTVPFTGALPQVIPGRRNIIRYLSLTAAAGGTRNVTWTYYPRYLHLRPATS